MINLALIAVLAATSQDNAQSVRRYALIVGSNDGGKERVQLRYANTDASSLASVFGELGGVQPSDLVLLREANARSLRDAFAAMKQRIEREGRATERAEFFLYYSGHSDEQGLLPAGTRVDYADLRALIAQMPAEVKIAIVDSCASGALVRLKGGEHRPAFLVDASAHARGHAFITSSSADESAQESDRIGGSFFTHFFVSGLRGAADTTGDKRVTLNEAYHFAFNETLQRTERTQSGPQHASYDIQLAGSGDLVMTDVRSTHAGIVFDEPLAGRLFVREQGGRLVVELDKLADKRVEIGLSAGTYAITRDQNGKLTTAQVEVLQGQRLSLDNDAFLHVVAKESTVRRGDGPVEPASTFVPQRLYLVAGLAGSLHSARATQREPQTRVMLQAVHLRVAELHGFALGLGVNEVGGRAFGGMFTLASNYTHGPMRGAQFAVGPNVASDWVVGAQASTLFNYAGALTGVQMALVNVTKGMRGAQLGLFNYASNVQKGLQLGLINIAEHSDGEQLGLFSYSGNVPMRLQFFTSDINAFNLGFRYGSKHIYGLVLAGIQPFFGAVRGSVGLGGGVHLPFWHLYVDLDVNAQMLIVQPVLAQAPYLLTQARAIVGGQIAARFALFAGVTFNLSVLADSRFESLDAARNISFIQRSATDLPALQIWPGFIAGIQI